MQGRRQGSGDGIARLQHQLGDLTQENEQLRFTLLEAETSVSQLQAELEQLRRDLSEQAKQQKREQLMLREVAEENLAFTSYVRTLQATNRSLYESNSCLRWALRLGPDGSPRELSPPARHHSPLAAPLRGPLEGTDGRYPGGTSPSPLLPTAAPQAGRDPARSSPGLGRQQSSGSSTDTASSLSGAGSESSEDAPPASPCSDTEQAPAPQPGEAEGPCHPARHSSKRRLPAFAPKAPEAAEEPAAPCPVYRLVLAGDSGAGKSSFLLRLCTNDFRGDIPSTLGVDFQVKQLLVDGEQTTLQIWDTAGQERFRSVAKSYFRKAHGVLLLYDISSESSFLSVRQWIEDIKGTESPLPLMLVGNKIDLRPGLPEAGGVHTTHGEKLAMAHSALFCETSAKDGTNVVEAVLHLAREVKRTAALGKGDSAGLDLSIPPRAALSCCRT
ncbi:ras and EF-hand domain-containing protein-like [Dromaius novaehollandiae]|uniref:ras and EF-hand domain-containing protein-like n=1 Tax=Dromaius novaehollandiae TaxID=8790 RepID=UPI00311F2C37